MTRYRLLHLHNEEILIAIELWKVQEPVKTGSREQEQPLARERPALFDYTETFCFLMLHSTTLISTL